MNKFEETASGNLSSLYSKINTEITLKRVPKTQGSLGNVRTKVFVFTNFQVDNYGTSAGDYEGNCGWVFKDVEPE